MDNFDLKIIRTLYECKNITNTAKLLFVSQPALTERIKRLELELNTKLIETCNKGVTFTNAGKYVAEYAKETLTFHSIFLERLANMNEDVSGTLRIGAPSIIARYYLPLLLQEFNQLYPHVTFDVSIANSSELLAALKQNELHFAFVREDFGWADGVKKLLTVNYLCAVSKTKFNFEYLPDMPRVDYQTDAYFRAFLDNWWNSTFKKKPTIVMQVSNLDLCKEMVFSGVGFSLLPSIVLADHPEIYQVPLCDEKGEKILRKTWILCKDAVLKRILPQTFFSFIDSRDFETFLRRY